MATTLTISTSGSHSLGSASVLKISEISLAVEFDATFVGSLVVKKKQSGDPTEEKIAYLDEATNLITTAPIETPGNYLVQHVQDAEIFLDATITTAGTASVYYTFNTN